MQTCEPRPSYFADTRHHSHHLLRCGFEQHLLRLRLLDHSSPEPAPAPAAPGCLAAFVANGGSEDVKVVVEYKGVQLDAGKFSYLPNGSGAATTYAPLTNATIPQVRSPS